MPTADIFISDWKHQLIDRLLSIRGRAHQAEDDFYHDKTQRLRQHIKKRWSTLVGECLLPTPPMHIPRWAQAPTHTDHRLPHSEHLAIFRRSIGK